MLPRPPALNLEVVHSQEVASGGFLQLHRRRCVARYPSGHTSEEFSYDSVVRRAFDAVVIIAYFEKQGVPWVYLRSNVRPPLGFRHAADAALASSEGTQADFANLWELPAGLIDETGPNEAAVRAAGVRELFEEAGLQVTPEQLQTLGSATFPCPALIAERQYYVCVEVNPETRQTPEGDGPLERHGETLTISLPDALAACREGLLPDAKTELGLRRFWELWQSRK